MRRLTAVLATLAAPISIALIPAAAQADTGPACPSGTTAVDYRFLEGANRAKTCFKGVGDIFSWQDIEVDGISAYSRVLFYKPGVGVQFELDSPTDSNGADNGWLHTTINIDESRSLKIWACSVDIDRGIDYLCGEGTNVVASKR